MRPAGAGPLTRLAETVLRDRDRLEVLRPNAVPGPAQMVNLQVRQVDAEQQERQAMHLPLPTPVSDDAVAVSIQRAVP